MLLIIINNSQQPSMYFYNSLQYTKDTPCTSKLYFLDHGTCGAIYNIYPD